MIVMAIIGVMLAIAFNQYRGMQARGNDASAVGSLRAIAAAQWQFALTCGNMKYATVLPDLARPMPSTGEGVSEPGPDGGGHVREVRLHLPDDGQAAGERAAGLQRRAGRGRIRGDGGSGASGRYRRLLSMASTPIGSCIVDEEETFTGNLPESGAAAHGGEVK